MRSIFVAFFTTKMGMTGCFLTKLKFTKLVKPGQWLLGLFFYLCFFLFPRLKNHLKEILENIETTLSDQIKAVSISRVATLLQGVEGQSRALGGFREKSF